MNTNTAANHGIALAVGQAPIVASEVVHADACDSPDPRFGEPGEERSTREGAVERCSGTEVEVRPGHVITTRASERDVGGVDPADVVRDVGGHVDVLRSSRDVNWCLVDTH